MEISQGISLLIVSLAAAVLPSISRRLRIPSPVAEILFGVILGKSLLNLHMGSEWLPFLAEMGFLLLMFQAGMEIDFTLLKGQGLKKLSFQAVFFGTTLALAVLAVILLAQNMFIALVLSTTSLGLVMPVLKENKLGSTPFGQTVLVAATLADFLTLQGITVYIIWFNHGAFLDYLIPLLLFLGFALVIWGFRLWAWWHPEKAENVFLEDSMQERGVRISLALLFLFVALSELAHMEPVLGAFMGGAILSFTFREKKGLESKIAALGFGFLIPIFFIHVGMNFDISNILDAERLIFTFKLLGFALLVKLVPSLLFPLWRMKLSDGLKAGVLLSSRLSLIIAAAAIGLKEGFMTIQVKDSIVLLALMTCFLGPVVFQMLHKKRRTTN